jgi:heterodisulfide reductase subunit C
MGDGMIVEYEFRWQCRCPVDHRPDVYRTVVRADRAIPVEDILKAAAAIAEREAFQEHLTAELHRALAAEVETEGWHSGVRTRVVCRG